MKDDYYTPAALARDLIALSQQKRPARIADFSLGCGSLLAAAQTMWPNAKLYGVDLDPAAISEAQNLLPNLKAFKSDFLSDEVLAKTKKLYGSIDLIVLNPPFTCRGASFETTVFEGSSVKCSKAMAFILQSCRYMKSSGELLAIIPRSCLFSQKDRDARDAISKSHALEDLGTYQSPGFQRASVSVHLIRITKAPSKETEPKSFRSNVEKINPSHDYNLLFMRGNHPVSKGIVNACGPSLIHTTDLFNSEISISRRRAVSHTRMVSGPVLMLPRVARPNLGKIAVGTFVKPVVPSDCIICVKTDPLGYEVHLQEQFKVFWSVLKNSYSGTCASYLTMEAFEHFASTLGFKARLDNDSELWNPVGASAKKDKLFLKKA